MFAMDLLSAYVLMALLFLRQMSISKHSNKINYAPLILSIGALFAIIHFILYIQEDNFVEVLKQSASSILLSLFLYMIVNVINQAQKNEEEQSKREFSSSLASKISQMKEYIDVLEDKVAQMREDENLTLFKIREDIKNDLLAQKHIQENQVTFMQQLEVVLVRQNEVVKTLQQLPELDQVMHNHIDLLRIAEQDHFNRIKKAFDQADDNRCNLKEEIADVKEEMHQLKSLSQDVAQKIIDATLAELSDVTLAFQKQLNTLRAQSEGVSTSLFEGENILSSARSKSEMLLKQIVLSLNNMKTVEENTRMLSSVYLPIKNLLSEIEFIKADYQSAYQELGVLAKNFVVTEKEQLQVMRERVEELSEKLVEKIDASLEKLHSHYHIASSELSPTVSELSKKAKLSLYEE